MKDKLKVVTSGGFIAGFKNGQLHLSFIKLDDNLLSIPKGHLKKDETIEECAIRELKEEVGLSEFEIVEKIGVCERKSIEDDGIKVNKTIHVFAMKIKVPLKPSVNLIWKTIEDGVKLLKFKEERKFLEDNREIIENIFMNKL